MIVSTNHAPRSLCRVRDRASAYTLVGAALLAACGGGPRDSAAQVSATIELTSASTDGSSSGSASAGGETTDDATTSGATSGFDMSSGTSSSGDALTTSGATTTSATTGDPPAPMQCGFESDSYGAGMQTIDVPEGLSDDLVFTVQGLPDPAVVTTATLRFVSHDADHPGEEGLIWVNGSGPYDLPADLSWDNQDVPGSLDISGATVAGTNTVVFAKGPLGSGSYYKIGDVMIELDAAVQDCPEPPPPAPVERTVWYQDASYTKRHNWVLRCDDYAFTAHGDEHIPDDCDGLYAPDGTRKGKATFAFPGLAAGTYEIRLRSRHTVNRNPLGALFVVDGEGKRVNQRDDLSYTTDIWGAKALAGDIEVVLDSSMESESDSVIWVKLVPQ